MSAGIQTTILQFGTGRFLRAFADLFAHEMNASRTQISPSPVSASVVAVQSTGPDRVSQFNVSAGRYHVAVRGLQDGQPVDRMVEVSSVRRAFAAQSEWQEVVAVACSESLAAIVSNATEAGYALDPADAPGDAPPRSFPAKLLAALAARFEVGQPGVTILPCELLEENGQRLRRLVLDQAARWGLSNSLRDWIDGGCTWRNTLVDRIVSAPRADDPMAARDPLFAVAEPFALWLIEGTAAAAVLGDHPAVQSVNALEPYRLRKVRILNGAHTALVAKARPLGFETVRQAVLDPEIGAWLEQLLFDEIVPTIEDRADRAGQFAHQCLERFANPYLDHRLADIALAHDTKLQTRLMPTYREFAARFGRPPRLLSEALGD
jgi:tagaturonate reductase